MSYNNIRNRRNEDIFNSIDTIQAKLQKNTQWKGTRGSQQELQQRKAGELSGEESIDQSN